MHSRSTTTTATLRRPPPTYRRGLARHPGDRVGFTPTNVMLAALIPFYDRYKTGSGVSMEVLREELTRAPT